MCTYIPSLLDLPPTPPPSHDSRSSQSTELRFLCSVAASHELSILHMVEYIYIYVNNTLNLLHPLLPALWMYISGTLSQKWLMEEEWRRTQGKIQDLGNPTPGRNVRNPESHTEGLGPCRGRPLQTGIQGCGWGLGTQHTWLCRKLSWAEKCGSLSCLQQKGWMDPGCHTKWSKADGEKQIS